MQKTVTVEITPAEMAQAFWNMSNVQQAEFFDQLAQVIRENHKTNPSAYAMGELQWHWLAAEMRNPIEGRQPGEASLTRAGQMLQAMAAPIYLHTLRAAEQAAGW